MTPQPLNVFACELHGTNLVEASAGTGKTWNICALYLRLLLELRLDVTQILVVSFTNAATAELRERIRSRIIDVLRDLAAPAAGDDPFTSPLLAALHARNLDEEELRARLNSALQAFDEAAIFTLHGFCERALRDVPFSAAMPLQLEVLTDDEPLCLEVASDFWRRRVAAAELPAGLPELLVDSGESPQQYAQLLRRQAARPLARLLWPERTAAGSATDPEGLSLAYAAAARLWRAEHERIYAIVEAALPTLNATSYKPSAIAEAAAGWHRLFAADDPFAADYGAPKLALFASGKLVPKKNQPPVPPHEFFPLAQRLLDVHAAVSAALEVARLQLREHLLAEALPALRELKRRRRVMSFDDMLYNLYERLTSAQHPALPGHLRRLYPAALIDEFQDTDPLQYEIFRTVYHDSGAPLFLVGDPKQSIYSFRKADLYVYLRARREAARIYTLTENQRCTQGLLHATNALFGAHARLFVLDGLDYVPLDYGAKPRQALEDRTVARAPLQLWSLPGSDGELALEKPLALQAAARATAAEIARLLSGAAEGLIRLGGASLRAGDIAVLVRKHTEGRLMREVLAERGIASVERSQASVFASAEAQELERVLSAVVEPTRTSLLHAALSTVLLGGTAQRVAALGADDGESLEWMGRLVDYRDAWLAHGIGFMLRRLIVEQQVAARLLSLAQGERRLTNLLHLCELLQAADEQPAAPDALLRWLQAQIDAGGAIEEAQLRLETDRNLVQIVTIHQAKGLEFPFVFCPFLWDAGANRRPGAQFGREYHDENGTLIVDFRTLSTAELEVVTERQRRDELAESMRVIYVALTRAVQRCYLVVGSYLSRGTIKESQGAPLQRLVGEDSWAALSARAAPYLSVQPLPQAWTESQPPVHEAVVPLCMPPAPPRVRPGWRLGSYSQLVHGAVSEDAAVDHDLRVRSAVDMTLPDTVPPADILRFPRGMTAGDCIHAVFETVDFTQPQGWEAAIGAALRRHPQAPRAGSSAAVLPEMLATMVRDVVSTPLPGGVRLDRVPWERRLVELHFHMPAAKFSVAGLRRLLAGYGLPSPLLTFRTLYGYLEGAIDLVFEADGRYWIIDWKGTYLGATAQHYDAASLGADMDRHHYHLQYLLYLVALHRYLRSRISGYAYERHVGGALYLYVRGVRPAWCDSEGMPAGVFAACPPPGLIAELSALLDAPGGDA